MISCLQTHAGKYTKMGLTKNIPSLINGWVKCMCCMGCWQKAIHLLVCNTGVCNNTYCLSTSIENKMSNYNFIRLHISARQKFKIRRGVCPRGPNGNRESKLTDIKRQTFWFDRRLPNKNRMLMRNDAGLVAHLGIWDLLVTPFAAEIKLKIIIF